jgi:alpha-tubulin suppressor-like RCC1 family protein
MLLEELSARLRATHAVRCIGLIVALALSSCGGGGGDDGGGGPPIVRPPSPLIDISNDLTSIDGELVDAFMEIATDVYETWSGEVMLSGGPGVSTSVRNDATGEIVQALVTQRCDNILGAEVCTDIWAAPPIALALGRNVITVTNSGGSASITIHRIGLPRYSTPVRVDDVLTFTDIAAGAFYSCGISTGGQAYCWGDNEFGQLGSSAPTETCGGDTFACSSVPVPVDGGLSFVALSGGLTHSCGIDDQGDAYCWGRGTEGQLGDGKLTDSAVPVAVAGGLTFTSISASRADLSTCAVTAAGAAWCWGENLFGEAGNGSKDIAATPVQVATALALGPVSLGITHACAVAATTDTLCWGDNAAGQLGIGSAGDDGGIAESLTPTTVLGGLTFERVVAGFEHACALDLAGEIYCWGAGDLVGVAVSDTYVTTPLALDAGSGFVDLASGDVETCALDATQTAHCWGPRLDWRFNSVDRFEPEPVLLAQPFEKIASGSMHTCGLGSDSFVYCWGNNPWGQVGRPPSDP